MNWSAKDLRLTPVQADHLRRGSGSVHQRVTDRTELLLSARKMFAWKKDRSGEWYLGLSPKGEAALAKFYERDKR
jgi:hypothetical protein